MSRYTTQIPYLLRSISVVALCAATACEKSEPTDSAATDDTPSTSFPNSHPNVILMLADDFGFDDMSYRNNQCVSTPYLDAFAEQSTRFESFYVHSVSAPTRASLLTGRHFLRTGVSGVHSGRDFVNLDEVTIAEVLKDAGYKTGMWGKWHSGKSNGYYPWERGFDEAYMASLYHHSYNDGLYYGEYEGKNYYGTELSFDQSEGKWTDATMTDMAIDFMTRNKDEKFFAYIPYLTPHESWDAPDYYINKYKALGQSDNFATLNGMLEHLDYQVGRVIAAVEQLGIADNTVIIFMSDNGPNYNTSLLTASEWGWRNPSGYNGSKSKNLENGIHSPLFIYWKGHTTAVDNDSVLSVCDMLPTICDLTGASTSKCKPLDGKSFYSVLASPSITDNSREIYISHYAPFDSSNTCLDNEALTDEVVASIKAEYQHIGLRSGDYKLLLNEYNEDATSFWNIKEDYAETKNLNSTGTSTDKTNAATYKNKVLAWYNEILADEGSFTTTTFYLGDTNYDSAEILCYAPIANSSTVTNDTQKITGFETAGEYATYSVNVMQDGEYTLQMYIDSKSSGNEVFTISTNLASNVAEITFNSNSTSSKTATISLTSDVTTLTMTLKNSISSAVNPKWIVATYAD
ncbi:MAG: sulfatase-like hydrolase/transferase [Rikenellaceae bacterium]